MPDPVLFPLHEDLVPDTHRTEPLVWIRRLVILRQPDREAVIRDVPFECGLNVIRTEERSENEEGVVAHSVGKTLLMRLVRYTAGETNYASDESQDALAKVLPDGIVIAHWRVDGSDWIVRRPLHKHDVADSEVIESDQWQSALDDSASKQSLKLFLRHLDSIISSELPRLEITNDRTPKWSDMLGWLARDCECGYRQANDWRHADTNAGSPGDLSVNKLMMQWLCGLMTPDEAKVKNEHRRLLAEHRKAKAAAERQSRTTTLTQQNLKDSMGYAPQAESSEEDDSEFMAGNPERSFLDYAQSMLDQSRALLEEVRVASPVPGVESKLAQLESQLDQAKASETEASTAVKWNTKHQRDLKTAASEPPLLQKCPADPCLFREKLKQQQQIGQDDRNAQRLAETAQVIQEQSEAEKQAAESRKGLEAEIGAVKEELRQARDRQSKSETKLIEQIGKWKQHVSDADRLDGVQQTTTALEKAVSDLSKAIIASNETQDVARTAMDHQQRVHDASVAYTQVLQRFFDENATGTFQVDGNGLQPKPAQKLTPNGRALSAMASVIAFDLACVMASIAGIGNHPRFLIHDSPREGEMEMPLFKRLFDVADYLESVFGKSTPAFQYIVTTTKAPPSFCTEDEPHTRLILHGREDAGRLLKLTF